MATAVILYDPNQIPLAVQDGVAIPANNQGILILGSDGTTARNIKVSATGVVSVDGSGSTQPVSGTVTANIGTTGGLALEATLGTRASEVTVASILTQLDVALSTRASQATLVSILAQLDVALSTRASEATVATLLTTAAFQARINTLGQKTMAASTPMVIASDQSAVAISAASLPLPTGASTAANQTTLGNQTTKVNDGTNTAAVKAASTAAVATDPALVVAISPNNSFIATGNKSNNGGVPGSTNLGTLPAVATAAAPTYTEGNQVAASTLLNGALRTDNTTWLGSSVPTVGQKVMASSIPTVIASDQSAIPIKFEKPTTASISSVSINAAASGNNTLIAAVASQTIRVFKLFLVTAANVDIIFRDNGATNLTGVMSFSKNGSITLDLDGEPWFFTTAGNAFVLNLSAAVQVSGRIYYTQS